MRVIGRNMVFCCVWSTTLTLKSSRRCVLVDSDSVNTHFLHMERLVICHLAYQEQEVSGYVYACIYCCFEGYTKSAIVARKGIELVF